MPAGTRVKNSYKRRPYCGIMPHRNYAAAPLSPCMPSEKKVYVQDMLMLNHALIAGVLLDPGGEEGKGLGDLGGNVDFVAV